MLPFPPQDNPPEFDPTVFKQVAYLNKDLVFMEIKASQQVAKKKTVQLCIHLPTGKFFVITKYSQVKKDKPFLNERQATKRPPTDFLSIRYAYQIPLHPTTVTFVSDFYPNGTLLDLMQLEQKGNAPKEWNSMRKTVFFYQLAKAMQHVHESGYIHRDLRPDKIFVNRQFQPILGDFTSFRLAITKGNESFSYVRGEWHFTAPEVLMGVSVSIPPNGIALDIPKLVKRKEGYDQSCDIFSFGMTLFAAMTFSIPLSELGVEDIVRFYQNGQRLPTPDNADKSAQVLFEMCTDISSQRPRFVDIAKYIRTNGLFGDLPPNGLFDESFDSDRQCTFEDIKNACERKMPRALSIAKAVGIDLEK